MCIRDSYCTVYAAILDNGVCNIVEEGLNFLLILRKSVLCGISGSAEERSQLLAGVGSGNRCGAGLCELYALGSAGDLTSLGNGQLATESYLRGLCKLDSSGVDELAALCSRQGAAYSQRSAGLNRQRALYGQRAL